MNEVCYLSTAQVAEALGVGVSTVKRWVDDAVLPAHKTPGGHRKLLLSDVLRLVREGNFPNVDLARLQGASIRETADSAALCRNLTRALIRGDGPAVSGLIHKAQAQGIDFVTLGDEVIAPALAEVGHQWETNRIDIYHEHRATQLCAGVLFERRQQLAASARNDSPLALGGAPEGDPYILPSLLIELILLELGWRVLNLGPNTPLSSFRLALNDNKPQLAWLSVSYLSPAVEFHDNYGALFRETQRLGTNFILGGNAIDSELRIRLPHTHFGSHFADVFELASAVSPTPQRPRRGRPRSSEASV